MHHSVLLQEVINGLDPHKGEVIVDCTINGGGHTEAMLSNIPDIKVIGLDADPEAIEGAKARLQKFERQLSLVNENFRNLDTALASFGIEKADKFLFDLGWSSNQLESGRGMSFQKNEPLNMAFGKSGKEIKISARDIVNEWEEENISTILYGYGEERYSRSIAKQIVEARRIKPIETTYELVEIIHSATPSKYHHGKIHPATRTFQALRIATNDELGALEIGLKKALDHLGENGRIAVITFHSIEDRIVKRLFREWVKEEKGILVNKKPITSAEEEIEVNPRARSAKLRIFNKK